MVTGAGVAWVTGVGVAMVTGAGVASVTGARVASVAGAGVGSRPETDRLGRSLVWSLIERVHQSNKCRWARLAG